MYDFGIDALVIKQLSIKIAELTTLEENINGAKSLGYLKKIMSSSHSIIGMREDLIHHEGLKYL